MLGQVDNPVRILAGAGLLTAMAGAYLGRDSSIMVLLCVGGASAALPPLIHHHRLTAAINDLERTFERWKGLNDRRGGRVSRFLVRPILHGLLSLWRRTAPIRDDDIRAGARLGAGTAFTSVFVWLAVVAVIGVAALALVLGMLYAIFTAAGSANDAEQVDSELSTAPPRRARGIPNMADGGHVRLDPETGVVQSRGWFGWEDLALKLDPLTGVVQKRGVFGWEDQPMRVDPDTGTVQEQGLMGWADTDRRVDPDSGVVQERGLMGWADTDVRFDPETGERQRRGLTGWSSE